MSKRTQWDALTRREFLNRSAGGAIGVAAGLGLAAAGRPAPSRAANEKIVVAIMGIRERGTQLAPVFAGRPDVEVAYLCDVDTRLFAELTSSVESLQGKAPQTVTDFRRVLDDKAVDALVVATPDHWHALPTIMACQAGKDVYLEKPVAHNLWEGRKMIEAARKYDRVVQVGTQNRSAPYVEAALEYIRSGKIGDIHLVRVYNMKYRPPLPPKPDAPVPDGVDYDMWLGPAPMRPFNENHFHYNWHWFWTYSGGDIINDGVHQLDLARWAIGQDYPKAVYCTGGKLAFDDVQETPDVQIVTWDFDDLIMTFEHTLYTDYMRKTTPEIRNSDQFPYWPQNSTRVEFYGTEALMVLGRMGGGWQVFGPEGEVIEESYGREPTPAHVDNFLQCVRDRRQPNADIEEGHRSTLLCHLGNISYRLGKRRLEFDPVTETFVGDEEANRLLKRSYRKPWVVPEVV